MKVFISGSITIKKLPKHAIEKLESIIQHNFDIIIGDAKGVDSLVQAFLLKKKYKNVMIYYAGDKIRNNIGKWKTKQIMRISNERGRQLYSLKDIEMAIDSDYGLMIWDGKSKGTLSNIQKMKEQKKKFLVISKETLFSDKNIDMLFKKSDTKNNYQELQAELF
jgi:hypothetical protein